MKKRKFAILILLIFTLLMCGCTKNEPADRTVQIPEDGVITRDIFERIKADDDIGVFNGNSNAITYQWLFMGNLIENPKDENLLITFSNAQAKSVKEQLTAEFVQEFSFAANETPGGAPSLSFYFPEPWAVDLVEIYRYDTERQIPALIATAALENSPNAIITFIPQECKGLFYLVGKNSTDKSTGQECLTAPEGREDGENSGSAAGGNRSSNGSGGSTTGASRNSNASDGSGNRGSENAGKDKYLTDPTPAGKPKPVEPEDSSVNQRVKYTCTLSIRCDTILNNMDKFNQDKRSVLPGDGVILKTRTVVFYEGESVFDVLKRETIAAKIHMEFVFTPIYNSAYIEGIHNLYEFDCGDLSGWMYKVNGWFPNYGCSRYALKNGDIVEWVYTCDLGKDVGGEWAVGG